MSSEYNPWQHILIQIMPCLFKECPVRNKHYFWEKYCFCDDTNSYPIWQFTKNKLTKERYCLQIGSAIRSFNRITCSKNKHGYWKQSGHIEGDNNQ